MARITIIYVSEGMGHIRTAEAAAEILRQAGHTVEVVDLVDVLRDETNADLTDRDILDKAYVTKQSEMVKSVSAYFTGSPTDVVISTVPFFNGALARGIEAASPAIKYVTLVTDYGHFESRWLYIDAGQHLIVPNRERQAIALGAGFPTTRVHKTNGIVVSPAFYLEDSMSKAPYKEVLGLPVTEPVGMVMYGGYGHTRMRAIQKKLMDHRLIFVCGWDEGTAEALRETRNPKHIVLGNCNDVAIFMKACDYIVTKPGPGTITEAIAAKVVPICLKFNFLYRQEDSVEKYVKLKGIGIVDNDIDHLRSNISKVLSQYDEFQGKISERKGRETFDLNNVLINILKEKP